MPLTRSQMLVRNTESERKADWFGFLRHAFDGSEGFAPVVPSQLSGGTGAIASMPTWWDGNSYLLKHEGEELDEWYDRILRARYPNHPRKAIGAWMGLLLRRGPTRIKDKADPALARFLDKADGAGRTWDDVLRDSCNRAILGGCLALVDRPNDEGAQNRAQSGGPAYASLIDPDSLYEWQLDSWNRFEWAKIVEPVVEQPSPDVAPIAYWRCRMWYRETWEVWLAPQEGADEPVLLDEGLNLLGEVPIVVLTFADALGRELFGFTPADELCQIARDDFQGLSRHGELLERQGFSILEVPTRDGEEKKAQQMDVGAARAVGTPMESARGLSYVAPADGPVASHERKHDSDRNESLRVMGLEQLLSSTAAPASALERQYEFQTTNADLSQFSARARLYEQRVHRLVMLYDGATEETATAAVADLAVEWPDDFGIRDQQGAVALAQAVSEIPGMDPVSLTVNARQVRDAALQLTDKERKQSDEWLQSQLDKMLTPDAQVPTEKILTPTAASGVVTVNEARANIGLGPLLKEDGSEDPNGALTVDEFVARRESAAKPAAPNPFARGFAAKQVAPMGQQDDKPQASPTGDPGAVPFDKGKPPAEPQIPA